MLRPWRSTITIAAAGRAPVARGECLQSRTTVFPDCRESSASDAAANASRSTFAVSSCRSVRALTIASGTSSATSTAIVSAR